MNTITRLNLFLILGVLVGGSEVEAQVFWDYSVSDGSNTMTGSFTTGGGHLTRR